VIRAAVIAAVLAGAAIAVWIAWPLLVRDSVRISVAGVARDVERGSTLADAVARFDLRPHAGSLLDVEGGVLTAGAYPGSILLNGARVAAGTELREGDRIAVVDGRDRREALAREVVPVPGGRPSDPQFTLAFTPGTEIVTRGAVSHKLVSSRFRPSGAPRVAHAVALTFDDGPWPGTTSRILRILERHHVPATFFAVGSQVERYPELVRRELRAGMAVGNHSYGHPNSPPFDELPIARIRDETARGGAALAAAGVHAELFRPPGGAYSLEVVRAANALGERVVLWSVDPTDWRPGTTARQIARRVLRAVEPGSIVLLHDGGGDRSATARALPRIIEGIRKKGLRLVSVAAPADAG
jgi:peptidoglycan/xylan/chitin deacetylase (PgdA/CDA1 family)/sulfur carrier protein ThiS